jgi:predicted enzyme related to lactoylglutathione lyase
MLDALKRASAISPYSSRLIAAWYLHDHRLEATASDHGVTMEQNFRVANLDRMIAQLRAKGVAVALDPEIYANGRFARLSDLEGNPIELWEPKADS